MKIIDINGAERKAKKAFVDPDYPGYVRIEFRRHHEWMTIQEFTQKNPKLKEIVKGAQKSAPDIASTVTSAAKDSLQDTKHDFGINEYMGYKVWIARGHGEGQVRSVIKNDKHIITIDKPWETKPNNTSQYVLAKEIDEKLKAMGNTLPVEDMKALEEKARKMDIKAGREPAKRQYTKDN